MLVASCNDLPRVVSQGGCATQLASDSFPQTLREAVPTARPEDAYPVCIFGSQVSPLVYHPSACQSMCFDWNPDICKYGCDFWLSLQQANQIEVAGSCDAAAIHSSDIYSLLVSGVYIRDLHITH